MVREIKGNILSVLTADAGVQYLLLGGCTRIEIMADLPTLGSIIFWKGFPSYKNVFDVYFMLVL